MKKTKDNNFFHYCNFYSQPGYSTLQKHPLLFYVNGFVPSIYYRIFEFSGFEQTSDMYKANIIVGSNKAAPLNPLMLPQQRIDHFEHTFSVGSKHGLHNILALYQYHTKEHLFFYPKSFLLPAEKDQFLADTSPIKTWIVKPAGGSCGRGIHIIRDKNQKYLFDPPNREKYVVQEYIERPLLINGYKFDLRFYVAVTSINPLRVYNYRDGLVRLATTPYNDHFDDLEELSAHLTNLSVNKETGQFIVTNDVSKDGQGSKWSHEPFWPYMQQHGFDVEKIKRDVDDCISIVFQAARPKLIQQKNLRGSVELYGVDILLDEKGNIHLEEVNVSPALGCSSKLDSHIKYPLLADFLNLSLIQDFSSEMSTLELIVDAINPQNCSKEEKDLLEYVSIMEFEAAQHRLNGWRLVFPNQKKAWCATYLDETLRLWMMLDPDKKERFLKKKEASMKRIRQLNDNISTMCSI